MQIYINKNRQQFGPFEENVILEMLKNGQLSPNDLGIKQGQQNWQKLSDLFPNFQPPNSFSPQSLNSQTLPKSAVKTNSSNGLKYGLFGCGGLLLLSLIGLVAVLFLGKRTSEVRNISANSNLNTVSATPSPSIDLYKEDSARREKFEAKKSEFIKLPTVQLTKQPYIKGKVAFYNQDNEVGDKDKTWMPDNDFASSTSIDEKVKDVKAKSPEEVETVVLRVCNQFSAGRYTVNGEILPGYNWKCEVSIIDRTIPAVIFKKPFSGKMEREVSVKKGAVSVSAYIPYSDIANFLGGLPRK